MYHQFKQLADVDITAQAMEVGPTMHYIMGGIRVDADTTATTVPGLFAAGECAGGMHGANRLGGNSLSDLLVFGRRAGLGAAADAAEQNSVPEIDEDQIEEVVAKMREPFGRDGEGPYEVHSDLQEMMQKNVGIIRTETELDDAVNQLKDLKDRSKKVMVSGHQQYNPGWHLAMDLESLVTVSEAIARAAYMRKESRGGHTRDDYPTPSEEWGNQNISISQGNDGEMEARITPLPEMPAELKVLFEEENNA